MALAAELLLRGKSATAQLSRTERTSRGGNIVLCEMCKKVEKRYTCPGCSVQTCSVECCKIHKEKLGCDGRRDETAFKMLSQFDDNALLSDYLFLEKASRMVNGARRGFRKFRLEVRSEWVSKLVRACSRRRINLQTLAPNMSRGFSNKTCFQGKRDVIMWQIEWLFPSISRKYIQTSVFEYDRVPDALFNLITTNHTAAPVLRPYKMHYSLADDEKEKQQKDCALSFLLRVKPNRNCFDRWRLIDKGTTLAANLRLQCIVEHPTIAVFLPNESPEAYLALNGKAPSWIAKRTVASAKVDGDEKKGNNNEAFKAEEKEDGEVSESDSDVQCNQDDEKRITDSEDEATCSSTPSKKVRLAPKKEQPAGKMHSFSLVAYDTEDSEEEDC